MTKISVECSFCKRAYEIPLGEYNKKIKRGYKNFYCSKKCMGNAYKQNGYKICPNCKKKFHSKPSWGVKYCSLSCYWKARKKNENYGNWNIKYSFNESFFEKINSESNAYILGFLLADGYISNSEVQFISKDYEILEKINRAMNSNYKISKRKNNRGEWFILRFSRKKISIQVRSILQIESGRKFDRLHYPNIPKELDKHFIRGFLDGDGSVSCSGRISFFSMSKNFLEEIGEKINQHTGIRILKISQQKNKCYRLTYQKNTAKKLGNWLYENATIFLERKKKQWEKM